MPDGDPDSASNEMDSSATSPDRIPVLQEARDADVFSGGPETRAQSFFMKRGGKSAGKGEGVDRPPEVKIHRHGRASGKGDSWRSTHMVQCLRYHKVGSGWCRLWMSRKGSGGRCSVVTFSGYRSCVALESACTV